MVQPKSDIKLIKYWYIVFDCSGKKHQWMVSLYLV